MARTLITDWKRIGRSGPTLDGRVIPPEAIDQCAKNYDKELFCALIWPEHLRFVNLGKVEALRSAGNNEGGRDLFARLAPNDFYLASVKADQKLFTSMELTDNFRQTGEFYLVGLGATDDPASAATSEILFHVEPKQSQLMAEPVEMLSHQFDAQESKPSIFQRLAAAFSSPTEDLDMADKTALEQMQGQIDALRDEFKALQKPPTAPNAAPEGGESEIARLTALFSALDARVAAIEKPAQPAAEKTAVDAIAAKIEKLSADLEAALKEVPGTKPPEHFGSVDELAEYV